MASFMGAIPTLLTLIFLLLLYHFFRARDFYVVEHLIYDLKFIETPGSRGKTSIRVEQGSIAEGSRSVGFCDYAAAKASFDFQENLHAGDPISMGIEAIHRVYVVSASRKPANAPLKDDKYRQTLLHQTPYALMFARRKEAAEERQLEIENKRAGI